MRNKRKKVVPVTLDEIAAQSPLLQRMVALYRTLVPTVRDGRDVTACFEKLPARRHFSDYYRVIKRPISLIHRRHRKRPRTVQAFIDTMAKIYPNGRG